MKNNARFFTAVQVLCATAILALLYLFPGPANADNGSDAIDWEYQRAYQRGIEVMNWAIPAVSILNLRRACFDLGGDFNTVYWISQPPTAKQETLTANNQTPYASIFLTTKDGPVILEIPPATKEAAIFGSGVDVWQEPIVDMGPAGLDQGKGGRYLFLPPGFKGEIPEGMFPVKMHLYDIFIALRCIPLGKATFSDAAEYSKRINAYPLNAAPNPPRGEYIDMAGKHLPTLPTYDMSFFRTVAELMNHEPLLERDKVMGGMLASIGIEKDKPFTPDGTIKKALEQAAKDGFDYLEYMFETTGYSTQLYWKDRQWLSAREPSKEGFVFAEGDILLLDQRAAIFHWVTYVPRRLGKASAYLMTMRDDQGALLSAKGNYRLTVPADVPAKDFWSVIAYSKKTKSFIYNDEEQVGLSSYDKESMHLNDDGSVDIYFGKTPPKGLETNWIPTAGEDFFLLFRFYGPEERYFDKSFKLPDVQKMR